MDRENYRTVTQLIYGKKPLSVKVKPCIKAKVTSVNFGNGNPFACRSTSNATYLGEKGEAREAIQAGTRNSSFKFGCSTMTSLTPYATTTSFHHNHKGQSSQVMAKLDAEKKKDLRRNHFDIGGRSASVSITTSGLAFRRPQTAVVQRHNKSALMTQTNWSGNESRGQKANTRPPSAASFVTNNMISF